MSTTAAIIGRLLFLFLCRHGHAANAAVINDVNHRCEELPGSASPNHAPTRMPMGSDATTVRDVGNADRMVVVERH